MSFTTNVFTLIQLVAFFVMRAAQILPNDLSILVMNVFFKLSVVSLIQQPFQFSIQLPVLTPRNLMLSYRIYQS